MLFALPLASPAPPPTLLIRTHLLAFGMPGGRPKGSWNAPGHSAGGKRDGAGRKPKVNSIDLGSLGLANFWSLYRKLMVLYWKILVCFGVYMTAFSLKNDKNANLLFLFYPGPILLGSTSSGPSKLLFPTQSASSGEFYSFPGRFFAHKWQNANYHFYFIQGQSLWQGQLLGLQNYCPQLILQPQVSFKASLTVFCLKAVKMRISYFYLIQVQSLWQGKLLGLEICCPQCTLQVQVSFKACSTAFVA